MSYDIGSSVSVIGWNLLRGHMPVGNAVNQSLVARFREDWLRKGVELIDITPLCGIEINSHGRCDGLGECSENIYHIKIWYRDEIVAQVHGDRRFEVTDDDRYVLFFDDGFIIFRKLTCKGKIC